MTDCNRALVRVSASPLALAERWDAWAAERAERVLRVRRGDGVADGVAFYAADAATDDGWRPYDVVGGVAVIPVYGLILPSFPWLGCSFATGCAELRWQLRQALADDAVMGIALMIDSPGGYVDGVDETAAAVRAARAQKPLSAIVEAHAYSAAYWIASGADTISAPRTGGIGHVGILRAHMDVTGMFEKAGVKPTLIRSGEKKADGHPLEPLTDGVRSEFQDEVDALRRVFAEAVSEGRGEAIDVAGVLATEARAFVGPDALAEAVQLGLFDAILPAEEALAAFIDGVTAGGAGSSEE